MMLHQLVFTKLLGEIDYGAGAGGLGDFNAAGCVRPRLREPQVSACAAGPRAAQHGCRPGSVCAGSVCAAAVGVCAATLCGSAPAVADGAGVCVGAQLQHGGRLGLERPRRRLDLPGARPAPPAPRPAPPAPRPPRPPRPPAPALLTQSAVGNAPAGPAADVTSSLGWLGCAIAGCRTPYASLGKVAACALGC